MSFDSCGKTYTIRTFNFDDQMKEIDSGIRLDSDIMGTNWPAVYILHGNQEIYVGETSNLTGRMKQHRDPNGKNAQKRKKLNTVEIVFDSTFNKSAILDIEQQLIRLFRFEISQTTNLGKKSKYFKTIQNANAGQSKMHNYFNRHLYRRQVELLWEDLRKKKLAFNSYKTIVNDALFKFSPYTALNEEQKELCYDVLENIIETLFRLKKGESADFTALVKGTAGTGKTIVLLYMLVRMIEAARDNQNDFEEELNEELSLSERIELNREELLNKRIGEYAKKYGIPKIAYVAQMSSLRKTVGTVLKQLKLGSHKIDAQGPNDIVNECVNSQNGQRDLFDVIFVDESHRLFRYEGIVSHGSYKNACRRLYDVEGKLDINQLCHEKTTLDWIFDCSKTRVLVYDENQTVKNSDITPLQFKNVLEKREKSSIVPYVLKQQMRCNAGVEYIRFIDDIFSNSIHPVKPTNDVYDLKFYEDPNQLIEDIVDKDGTYGLCKTVAGYGWQWDKKKYKDCQKSYDIEVQKGSVEKSRKTKVDFYERVLSADDGIIVFGKNKYIRNLDFDWILKGDPREIGCIHTCQGYDLNYVGVLFGPEIDYSPDKGIFVIPENIKDTNSVSTNMKNLSEDEKKIQTSTN